MWIDIKVHCIIFPTHGEIVNAGHSNIPVHYNIKHVIFYYKKTYNVFGSTFVKLILDIINFVEIDLIRINFEIKWFIFDSSFKSIYNRK